MKTRHGEHGFRCWRWWVVVVVGGLFGATTFPGAPPTQRDRSVERAGDAWMLAIPEELAGAAMTLNTTVGVRRPAGVVRDRPLTALIGSRSITVVWHQERGLWRVHGVLPPLSSGPQPCRFTSRPGTDPVLSLTKEPRATVITSSTGHVSLSHEGGMVLNGMSVVVNPPISGSWTCRHHCDVRSEWVLGAPGGSLLCVGVTLLGAEVSVLSRGTANPRLTLAGAVPVGGPPGVTLPTVLVWNDRGFISEGAEPSSEPIDPSRCRFLTLGGNSVELLSPCGATPARVRISDAEVTLEPLAATETLRAGEGALIRIAVGFGELLTTRRGLLLRGLAREAQLPRGLAGVVDETASRLLSGASGGIARVGPRAGDWRHNTFEEGHLEYDTILGLLAWADDRTDPKAYLTAQGAADHLIARDHDAAHSRLFFPHGPELRALPVELGHHWIEGLAELVMRESDPLLEDALTLAIEGQREFVERATLDDLAPRDVGWALTALTVAAERDPKTRRVLSRLLDHVVTNAPRRGPLRLSSADPLLTQWPASPFIQGGIVAPALLRAGEVLKRRDATALARRLAGYLKDVALVDDADEDRVKVAARVVYSAPDDATKAAGAASGEFAALTLAGLLEVLPSLHKNPRVCRALDDLATACRASDKTYIGMDASLLLRARRRLEGLR